MWAVTGDDQIDPAIVSARDKEFKVGTARMREDRFEAIGYEVPKVSLPRSIDQIGRQWTDSGDDQPTPRS